MKKCLMCQEGLNELITLRKILFFIKLQQESICKDCRDKFNPLTNQIVCQGCGRISFEKGYCNDCINWKKIEPTATLNHQSLFEYNDWMKEWIEGFKFKGNYQLGCVFSEELKKFIYFKKQQGFLVAPIPSSQHSYANRGFNQVEALLDFAKVTYQSILLNESQEMKQSSKNRQERLLLKQPFSIKKEWQGKLEGKSVLLVDDVYTTGRTILYAKKLIEDSGASLVRSVSLAR